MKFLRRCLLLLLPFVVCGQVAFGVSRAVSFNLSTSKTFAPGEQPKIHLYTHNVDALEFRVYRVQDPIKFIENLRELHSFGSEEPFGPREQVDERTPIERFHDWKSNIWNHIRDFFRHQFSYEARTQLREKQSTVSRTSRIVTVAEFAQVPVLNDRQLVARWRQLVPSTYISDNNDLPIKALDAGLYLVEATDGHFKAYTLLMVSQMALVTRTGPGGVLAFVADRTTGAPVAGSSVASGFSQHLIAQATTDTEGVAQLAIADPKSEQDNFWVVASHGSEVAVSTPQSYSLSASESGKWAGYVFTDRPVYRQTHTVHWKAILREHSGNSLALPKVQNVHVTIVDDQDKAHFDGSMAVNSSGALHGDFDLPKDAPLGYYTLRVGDGQDTVSADFHVEDYRKPEYRVQVTSAQKRILEGTPMQVTIDSRYFFGEPVANAKVKYRIFRERHYWFGEEESDNNDSPDDTDANLDSDEYAGDAEQEKTGKLDADGKLVIIVPTSVDAKQHIHNDLDYTVEAGVTDAANREVTGRGKFLATYGTFRMNVEPVTYAVRAGEAARFRVTVVDYDDKPVQTRVHVQLVYHHYADGKSEKVAGSSADVTTDANGVATGSLPLEAKKYSTAEIEATASAIQPGTRDVMDESYVWIMGAGEVDYGEDAAQSIQIIADKKVYAPGDTAHLSIVSEAAGFHALVIVQGNTIQKREVMDTDERTLSFDLPINPDSQPNVTVEVVYLKNSVLYQSTKILKVPPTQQQLQVQITPTREVFQPQQDAEYDVKTLDASGKPVSANLSFGVVDEAIYSLYPDLSGDMVRRLYPQRNDNAQFDSSLSYYFSGEAGTKSPMLAMRNVRYRPQLAQVKPGNEAKPRVRKAFPDTAYWNANVQTDANGHALVTLTFPDSLTTWRATVHAITADSKAGSAISRVLVRKNILVRMGNPRFLRKGDDIIVPVIVHNYLDVDKQAKLSVAVEGLEVLSGAEQTITVPSKGEATAVWHLRATDIGNAKLTATALTDAESDALELTFPVQPDGVVKTIAPSGFLAQTEDHVGRSIVFPSNTDAASHSMRIEVSSSIAGSLFSALDFLTSFPYGCTEQTMSSYLPNVIVAETFRKLRPATHIDEADLRAKMEAGLDRLADYQHDDGGWGWWKEDESRIYMTAYVVGGIGQGAQTVLLHGKQAAMLEQGKNYLETALRNHPRMRPELRAAVIYALAEAGEKNIKAALDLQWSRRRDLDPEALAMTGLAMLAVGDDRAKDLEQLLVALADRQGELVSWKGSYAPLLDADYENNAEATAFAIRLVTKVDSGSPLTAGAARWLMLNRSNGEWWDSTEQTAMVLFGLVDYLSVSHELDSDFTVEVLLNGKSAGQHHFTPSDAIGGTSMKLDLDATQLNAAGNELQIVRRTGAGAIYWSANGRYYTTDKSQYQAGKMSLNLTRDYFRLKPTEKDGRVVYDLEPLKGEAEIGDVLAVHEAISGSPMKYLLLEDPIPAGTEFITNDSSYPVEFRPGAWYGWYTRREFHDDHAAFFSSAFSGREEIFYLLKVVNPGQFTISPASVQPMYQPGVQATSDALQLHVPSPAGGAR